MPLPTGFVQIGTNRYRHNATGHICQNAGSIADLRKLGAAFIVFSNGERILVGGSDLEANLVGVPDSAVIGMAASLEVGAGAADRGSNLVLASGATGARGAFFVSQRRGAARTVSRVLGVEISPFVHGIRLGSQSGGGGAGGTGGLRFVPNATPAANVSVNLPAGFVDWATPPAATDTGYAVIKLPVGYDWYNWCLLIGSKYENANVPEVAAKIAEWARAVADVCETYERIPTMAIVLKWANGGWNVVQPTAAVAFTNATSGTNDVVWQQRPGAAQLEYGTNRVVTPLVCPGAWISGTETLIPVTHIDGVSLQHYFRGVHHGLRFVEGFPTFANANVTTQTLSTMWVDAIVNSGSGFIPARGVTNGVPVSNEVWGSAIQTAATNPANRESIAMNALTAWDTHYMTAAHAVLLMAMAGDPGKYTLAELAATAPTVYLPMLEASSWVNTVTSGAQSVIALTDKTVGVWMAERRAVRAAMSW